MPKKGMIPEAVDAMAQQIDTASQEVQTRYEEARGRLGELEWTGEDATAFRSRFEDEVGTLMRQAVSGAQELAARARSNAVQQREASAS
ncbi:hypothetical protein Bequi_13000 [Brachybacterium sp. JHP9]|uniref:WXG100 family type VII secretion target n=1 Tax=Brachybacterium equifaecis TaxID=2910770 RepID=A0ABT0R4D8_9MICO|nr:hypothetical protein [Brachybacterium equifaecis]MCL6424283.1 hypothetical protein [Brachybacterium equifaecis]